jgi:hypothetical protein
MSHIFISRASRDDDFVKQLRLALEAHRLPVWVDSRNPRGGDKLTPEIGEAIEQAGRMIVVFSPKHGQLALRAQGDQEGARSRERRRRTQARHPTAVARHRAQSPGSLVR